MSQSCFSHFSILAGHKELNKKTLGTINKLDDLNVPFDFCCQESPESAFVKLQRLRENVGLLSGFFFVGGGGR